MTKTILILVIAIFLSATFVYADMVIKSDGNITVNGDIDIVGNLTGTNVQKPLIGSCSAGSSIRAINIDGTITCEDDTDTDTLGGLTCTIEQVAKWGGSAWVCGAPGAPSSEPQTRLNADTQLQSNIDAEQAARVAEDTNLQSQITTLNNQSCISGTYVTGLDGSGNIICSDSGTGGIGSDCPSNLVPGADLHNCNLRSANLQDVYLMDANLEGAVLTGTDISCSPSGTDFLNANLDLANLILANLECANFYSATLRFADLRNAINIKLIDHADLSNADLRGATITGNISDSNFSFAKLTGVNLLGPMVFNNTDFHDADLRFIHTTGGEVIYNNCTLSNTDFSNADFRDAGVMIDGFVYPLNMSNVNFSYAKFGFIDFIGPNINMSNANFSYADFEGGVRFGYDGPVDLTNANFSNAKFCPNSDGCNTNFDLANLTNSNFTNAIFSNGIYTNTYFNHTNLSNANFQNATNMEGATFTNVIWDNTMCPDGTNSNDNGNTCAGHLTPLPPP